MKDLFKLKNSLGLALEPEFKLQDVSLSRHDLDLVEALVQLVELSLAGIVPGI